LHFASQNNTNRGHSWHFYFVGLLLLYWCNYITIAKRNPKAILKMKISLIIPTVNRSNCLKYSLPTFINQSLDTSSYEIIVIDNNSEDDTRNVVPAIMKNCKCNWKYCIEKNQGLHYARNRGILEAKSEIVVFGDDDILASENWLKCILDEYSTNENAGIVGGKILPQWEEEPPKWVYDWGNEKTHTVFAYLDNGDQRLSKGKNPLFGCNFSIRKDLAIKIGGSLPDVFPKNMIHLSGSGENGMIDQVYQLGYEIVYLSDAVVKHSISASRMTLDYFMERYKRFAIENVYTKIHKTKSNFEMISQCCIVLFSSFYRLLKSQFSLKSKINKKYFIKIMRQYYLSEMTQSFRILRKRQLYKYITKNSYLAELMVK
jgi:glycosyltransferase involved in cell wall biosynthesis